jgi:diguanylate cyclase (GGDEF)-like protein
MKITISFGVTEVEPSDESHETLFSRVDHAMYSAKKAGRNRVEMY